MVSQGCARFRKVSQIDVRQDSRMQKTMNAKSMVQVFARFRNGHFADAEIKNDSYRMDSAFAPYRRAATGPRLKQEDAAFFFFLSAQF